MIKKLTNYVYHMNGMEKELF